MTIEDVIAQEKLDHAAYEERTIGAEVQGVKYNIASLRRIFESVCDKGYWKNKWTAKVSRNMVPLVSEAVAFFHGARPEVIAVTKNTATLRGDGYAC